MNMGWSSTNDIELNPAYTRDEHPFLWESDLSFTPSNFLFDSIAICWSYKSRRICMLHVLCRWAIKATRRTMTLPHIKTKADSTLRASQAVPHPSTSRALRRLTSEVRRDPVHSTWYGRQRIILQMQH